MGGDGEDRARRRSTATARRPGLALINSLNPNHFVKTALQYKADTDPDTAGDQPGKWAERVLTVERHGGHDPAGDGAVAQLGRADHRR